MRPGLEGYETVADRLARFWADHPDGRVVTELVAYSDQAFIVRCEVYGHRDYPAPDATGFAEERVGASPVNRTSALENCETSAVGRALANLNYAPKGARPSREEMGKVDRYAQTEHEALVTETIAHDPAKVTRGRPYAPGSGWSHGQDLPPMKATAKQLRMIGALFGEAGVTERTSRLRIVSKVVGRAVESSKDLTTAEASRVIDHLKPAEEGIRMDWVVTDEG